MEGIGLNTTEVAQIALSLESLNKKLGIELEDSQLTVKGLASTWQGKASEATISAFDTFSAKYFETYKNMIDRYVKFLRKNVDNGYFEIEREITDLSTNFN